MWVSTQLPQKGPGQFNIHPSPFSFCLLLGSSVYMPIPLQGLKWFLHPNLKLCSPCLSPSVNPYTTYRLLGPRTELGDYRTSTLQPEHQSKQLCWRMFQQDVQALVKGEVWSMAVARVCTSEHFTEYLKEKNEKMKVCCDIRLGVWAIRSPLSCCWWRAGVHRWVATSRI